jgi:DnaK suppressor protein
VLFDVATILKVRRCIVVEHPRRAMTGRNGQVRRSNLLSLRARLLGDVSQMADAALKKEDDPVRMPSDMAELGTDAFEQQLTLDLVGNKKEVLEQIEAALERIEDGSYGQCEECGHAISRARLDAIPYTALCVKCASRQEEKQGP